MSRLRDVPDDVYPLQRADAVQLPEWQGGDELEVLAAAEGHRRRGHTELLGHAGCLDVDGQTLLVNAYPYAAFLS